MPTTTKGRILIPKAPKEGFELAAKIYAQHRADGAASELNQLEGASWATTGPTIVAGQTYHVEAERLKGLMEEQYRLRDAVFKPVDEAIRASSLYLKGKYAKNPKKLTKWGFAVDDTPRTPKAARPKPPTS